LDDLTATKKSLEKAMNEDSVRFDAAMKEREAAAFQVDSLKRAITKLYELDFTL